MSIERKYKKLGETALQLIRMDNLIVNALHAGNMALYEQGLTDRSPLVYKIQTLVEWKPERRNEQFE